MTQGPLAGLRRLIGSALCALWLLLPTAARAQSPEDPLAQVIDPNQPVETSPKVISDGHVDVGPRFLDGGFKLLIHDDSTPPSVWRLPERTVVHVQDAALQTVPDDPTYAFVGARPGEQVYIVPQVQKPGVAWLGWNTQDPGIMAAVARGVTLTLNAVQGPGILSVYLQPGVLAEPDLLWQSAEFKRQPFFVDANAHAHANWVFTKPGVYLVQIEVAADLVSGEKVRDVQNLRFAVGDSTDVDEALAVPFTARVPAKEAAAGRQDKDGSVEGSGLALIAGVGLAALLLGGVVLVARRGARAKRQAELEMPSPASAAKDSGSADSRSDE
ncbi:MAG: choice-of-anchor M domain-containing protein [Actinomycetota bacterium]